VTIVFGICVVAVVQWFILLGPREYSLADYVGGMFLSRYRNVTVSDTAQSVICTSNHLCVRRHLRFLASVVHISWVLSSAMLY